MHLAADHCIFDLTHHALQRGSHHDVSQLQIHGSHQPARFTWPRRDESTLLLAETAGVWSPGHLPRWLTAEIVLCTVQMCWSVWRDTV